MRLTRLPLFMPQSVTRRQALAAFSASAGVLALPGSALPRSIKSSPTAAAPAASFTPCLNLSTIRGQKLGLVGELETAAKAGFRSVEVWVDTLQAYVKTSSTADVRKRLGDLGLRIENAIGFAPWIIDDEAARAKGLDQMKREMELLAEVGCSRTAAPPVGAQTPGSPKIDLYRVAERYRAILELGDQTKVVPQLELWGFSANLNRLSEVLFVAIQSGHPSARVLLDIYHLYKGGSSPASLPLVGKPAIEVFHVNDYPANLSREAITDADRVFPGDGVAPITNTLKVVQDPAKPIVLSLEVFNKGYYAQDALTVAKTAFSKMQAMIRNV